MQICSTLLHANTTERLPHILLTCNVIDLCFCPWRKFDAFMRNWDLNEILTVTRFDILNELLRPFSAFETLFIQHLRPYWLFNTFFSIWHPFGWHLSKFDTLFIQHLPLREIELIAYLIPFPAFDTLLADIWDLIRYLRPFSAFDTLFIQHLRPYSLFEALSSIWHPFGGHLRPFGYLRPFSAFDTLLSDPAAHRPYRIILLTLQRILSFLR